MIDQIADLLLGQQPIDQIETHRRVPRQDLREEHPARGGIDAADDRVAILIDRLEARLDARMQRHAFDFERLLDLADIGEHHALARLAAALGR